MELRYQNNTYIIVEAKEPNKNLSLDMIVIFRVTPIGYEFIDYFFGVESNEEIEQLALLYIKDYLKELGGK